MTGGLRWRGIYVILGLSARDFIHERMLSTCAILGMAAILAPLLVLFGLKFGVVSSMTARLAQDPRARALQPIGQGKFDMAWFDRLTHLPETGFVSPTTRFLATTVSLRNPTLAEGEAVTAELWPTGPGDPFLDSDAQPAPVIERVGPLSYSIAVSQTVADKLHIKSDDRVEGRVGRTFDGDRESLLLTFVVAQVIRAGLTDRDVALVPLSLLTAIEDYREGIAAPELGSTGAPSAEGERSFANFRLYARTINDVAPLRDWLARERIETTTRLHDIEAVQRLSRDLTLLFLIISSLAGLGYLVWTALSSLSTVARKQREISLLRLIGFSTGAVVAFPIVQSMLTAVLGAALASITVIATEPVIDQTFAGQLPAGTTVFRLLPRHLFTAALITAGFAAMAASISGIRAAMIAPSEGLRDE